MVKNRTKVIKGNNISNIMLGTGTFTIWRAMGKSLRSSVKHIERDSYEMEKVFMECHRV